MLRIAALLILAAGAGALPPPPTGRLANVPGTCAFTRIRQVTQRLEDAGTHEVIARSGSAIVLADGVYGVSYDQVPAVNRARAGDPVMTCLAKLPRQCPPGDRRGKWYTTTDLRTDEAWTLPDSEHGCGGA